MENDFALYSRALLEGNAAEQEANELVDRITKILSPLSDWKRYCLSGLPEEIPHVLTKLGSPLNRNRQQIFVGSIVDDLQKLQSSMAKYAEATETAMEARGRMPADQQKQLAPPPWQFP
jgi:hypothetical protein